MTEEDSNVPNMAHEHRFNRRQFLKGLSLITGGILTKSFIPPITMPSQMFSGQTVPDINPKPSFENRPKSERSESTNPPIRSLSEVFNEIDDDTRTSPDQKQQLKDIMETVDAEKRSIIQTVWDNNILKGERGKSREDLARDLDIYFPIYKAVEKKFNIPWQLVWMMHTEETGASIHKYPDHGTTRGAVQIGYGHKELDPDLRDVLEKAINDSSIYKFTPGIRYDKYSLNPKIKRVSNSNDGEELFASGAFFNYFTTSNHNRYIKPDQSIEEKYLLALMNYVGQPNINNGVYAYRKRLYESITSFIPAADKIRQNNTSLHELLSL